MAFSSDASSLVPNDTNGQSDVFVRDLQTNETTRVSTSSSGVQGNSWSTTGYGYATVISADGRYVVFSSYANNLVANDRNNATDVFLHDRISKETTIASISTAGGLCWSGCDDASISSDGRYVTFKSSTALASPSTPFVTQVFLRDRIAGTTETISQSTGGQAGSSYSWYGTVSASGRFVAFTSVASNLVPGDTNSGDSYNPKSDVFIRDRQTGETTRVLANSGAEANGTSYWPAFSAGDDYLTFTSTARNLTSEVVVNRAVFLYDLTSHSVRHVGEGMVGSANANGRYVAYTFGGLRIRDMLTGATISNSSSYWGLASINADGSRVAFSTSQPWVADDTNGLIDIYVYRNIVDQTSPVTTAALGGLEGNNGWFRSQVTVSLFAADDSSGVAKTEYSTDGLNWTEYAGPVVFDAEGSSTVHYRSVDTAGNVETTQTAHIKIDTVGPQIALVSPGEGVEYQLGQSVVANWSVSDATSGVASSSASLPSGSVLDTSIAGAKSFAVEATDEAGNSSTVVNAYYIRYSFSGVANPINPDGSSIFRLGSTIPIKFSLADSGGLSVPGAEARLYVTKMSDVVIGTEEEAVSTSAASLGNLFRYDANADEYIFNLSTKTLSTGTWLLRIQLSDGASYSALMSLK